MLSEALKSSFDDLNNIIVGHLTVCNFAGILFTMLFMERLGRKKTIAGELLLTAASLSLLFFCTDR